MKIVLPYGENKVSFNVSDENFVEMLDSSGYKCTNDAVCEITRAIDYPIGTRSLKEIVSGNKKVCIIIDDDSRPTPISIILPILTEKLERYGVKRDNIKIVVALGSHRYMTEQELCKRVGKPIYDRYSVENSEFKNPAKLVYVGDTPEKVKIFATKSVMESDIRIGVGNLVPHPVMGWSGGGKILYPGIAGEKTVAYFHLKASLIDRNMFGAEDSPIRTMMETWVEPIGLDFIVNTVLTQNLELCKVVAGHYVEAHRQGVKYGKEILGFKVTKKADVVVVSSHPADQDFWQSPKGMYAAELALKGERGSTLILLSPNFEGIGPHAEFPEWMGRNDGDEIVEALIRGEERKGDPLAIAIGNSMSKMRRRRKLVVVSDGVTAEEMKICGCKHYPLSKLQQSLDDAMAEYDNCKVSAMTNGADTFLYE